MSSKGESHMVNPNLSTLSAMFSIRLLRIVKKNTTVAVGYHELEIPNNTIMPAYSDSVVEVEMCNSKIVSKCCPGNLEMPSIFICQ